MLAKNSTFGKKRNALLENTIVFGVFVFVLLGIMGFFLYQNVKIGQKRSDLENRLQELQGQLVDLSEQQEVLQADISEAQTQEYEEKVLREQGLYKKEGEQVVTILPAEEGVGEMVQEEQKKERVWWNPLSWF